MTQASAPEHVYCRV